MSNVRKKIPSIKNFLELLFFNLWIRLKNILEALYVIKRYYIHLAFYKVDLLFFFNYLLTNPFSISKQFLLSRNEEDVYTYGETPLTSLEYIVRRCHLGSRDVVFDLGCGTGRTSFFLHALLKAPVRGVEWIPEFMRRAHKIKKRLSFYDVEFFHDDMRCIDYAQATAIYLYGTCFSNLFIEQLVQQLKKTLRKKCKIITVSYSLLDICKDSCFELVDSFQVSYPWGQATVYVQTFSFLRTKK